MQRTNATPAPPPIAVQLSALLLAVLTACGSEPDDSVDPEEFRESCEQIMACDCLVDRYADVDTCMRTLAAWRAGTLAEIAAAGLTPNAECMDPYGSRPDLCLTQHEYEVLHPYDEFADRTECGVCIIASGDRQVGEDCTEFSGYVSDCAPGLLCLWTPTASGGICIDPCAPAAAGLPCDSGINHCGEGLHCSGNTRVCVPESGPGESCVTNTCGDHYTCDREQDRCVRLPGDGEPCLDDFCDWEEGLTCLPTGVCGPPPKLGEPCLHGCADDLNCHPFEQVCAPQGQAGDGCVSNLDCVPELFCIDMVCITGGDLGAPCDDSSSPCRLGLSCIDEVCGPGQGLICGEY